MSRHLFAFLLLLAIATAEAADYYVSAAGSNSNPGTSSGAPWQTLTPVNVQTLAAGDTVNFRGGDTFSGTLTPKSAGALGNPIIFRSYGTGRATISAGAGTGVSLTKNYVTIQNLNFTGAGGSGSAANTGNGADFTGTTGTGIDQCDITGFQSGVRMQGPTAGVRVTFVKVTNSRGDGLCSLGSNKNNTNLYIADSTFSGNGGWNEGSGINKGSGICLSNVGGGLIERCVAHHNGATWATPNGGPVGMWTWICDNVVFQYCESYSNTSRDVDGGGFDLDGGTTNSTIQYCYAHDNQASGYFFANWSASYAWDNNTVRYCISENDAKYNSSVGVGGTGGLNTWVVYVSGASTAAVCIESSGANVKYFNNIFITNGGMPLVNDLQNVQPQFRNNLYYAVDGNYSWKQWSNNFTSLAAWISGTGVGQETVGGTLVGIQGNPFFSSFATGVTLNDVTKLANMGQYLSGYRLAANSPAIDAGADLSLTSLIPAPGPGTRDFWGTTIKQRSAYDIGAHEVVPSVSYTISGTVTSGGSGLSGVTLSDGTRSATTAADGTYTISGVPAGTYTLTPSRTSYVFTPASTSVTVSTANITGTNFTGTLVATYTVSGTITRGGAGLSGVMVSDGTRSATTAANGTYTISGVPASSYTLTPTLAGFVFTPATQAVTVAAANLSGKDFTAAVPLQARWTFENASNRGEDTSGSNRTLTIGTSTAFAFASDASGVYQQITLPASAATSTYTDTSLASTFTSPAGTGPITLSAWFNATTPGTWVSAASTISRIFELPGYNLYTMSSSGGPTFLRFQSRRSTTSGSFDTPAVTLGQWYHVAVVYDPSSTTNVPGIYVNGRAVTVTTFTAPAGTQIDNGRVGCIGNSADGNRGFNGSLDNLRLYGGLLEAADISAIYAAEDRTVTTCTLTASTGANGTVTPSGVTTVASGGSQTYAITPAGGYQIASLMVDGSPVSSASSYTFTNVTANHTIAATFSLIPAGSYTISATSGSNGTVTPAGATTVSSGESQTYTITPATGYQIASLTVDGAAASTAGSYAFTNVTADHTIAAAFSLIPVTTYTVMGVVAAGGTRIAGVTLSDGTRIAITDANGTYTLTGVPAGTYVLTPSLTGYVFNPASVTITVTGTTTVGQVFSGSPGSGTAGTVQVSAGNGGGGCGAGALIGLLLGTLGLVAAHRNSR